MFRSFGSIFSSIFFLIHEEKRFRESDKTSVCIVLLIWMFGFKRNSKRGWLSGHLHSQESVEKTSMQNEQCKLGTRCCSFKPGMHNIRPAKAFKLKATLPSEILHHSKITVLGKAYELMYPRTAVLKSKICWKNWVFHVLNIESNNKFN